MASRTPNARSQVIAMLKEDHAAAKKAFREFEKLDHESEDDLQEREALVAQTCAELRVHAKLEEELFYPAVRPVLKEEDLVDEAEVEHNTLENLIGELEGMESNSSKFAATFRVLGEYVKHHVKEEENEMFAQLERAKLPWDELLQNMQTRREELMAELGLTEQDEEAVEQDDEEVVAEQDTDEEDASEAKEPAEETR